MRCLFFGPNGYLGKNLVQSLRLNGHEVIIPSFRSGGRLDLRDKSALDAMDWNVDAVYMFAGVTGTSASFDDYKKFVEGNELILLNLLDAIRKTTARPRLIFPSTRLVYADCDAPQIESSTIECRSVYAVNKIACEGYLSAYSNAYDIPFTIFRIGVPYGNNIGNEYSYGTVGNFIEQSKKNGVVKLYGGGAFKRTFTHIDDVSRIVISATNLIASVNQIYNMPGEELSLREAASLIANRFGATVESVPWPMLDLRLESGSTVFNGSRLLETLKTNLRFDFRSWAKNVPLVDR